MNNYYLRVSISRSVPFLIVLICLSLTRLAPVFAQDTGSRATNEPTLEDKVQNALSAAPDYIAREAAVCD